MKECRTCKISKPLTDFYKRAGSTRGYLPDCKPCELKRQKRGKKNKKKNIWYNKTNP